MAAVPITATVAPAAVIVASLRAIRAGHGVPAVALVKQDAQGRLVVEARPPARAAQRGAVHHPWVHHVSQVDRGRRGHAHPVQPLRGPERQPGGQLDALQPADPLDLVLLEPAVAAHREVPFEAVADRALERGDEVLDVAELPAGRGALHREQAGRLEVPGDQGVHRPGIPLRGPALADQGGRPDDRHGHAGIGPGRAPGQLLDLQHVARHAAVRLRGQRGVLWQRHLVVRPGPVHHRAGHEHDPADAPGRGGGEHGLRAAYVERPALPAVGIGGKVKVCVHDHVDAGQLAGQRRVADVGDSPGHALDVAALFVDRDDPLDLPRRGQPGGQGVPDAAGRAGDRHHGHRLVPCCAIPLRANRPPGACHSVLLPR